MNALDILGDWLKKAATSTEKPAQGDTVACGSSVFCFQHLLCPGFITCEVTGGLGNQLFQVSLLLSCFCWVIEAIFEAIFVGLLRLLPVLLYLRRPAYPSAPSR